MAYKNLGKRVLVAGIGGPVVLAASWFGGVAFFILVLAIALLASWEFLKLLEKKGSFPAKAWVGLATLAVCALSFFQSNNLLLPTLLTFILGLLLIELMRAENNALLNVAGGLLAFFYLAFLYAFLIAVRELPRTKGMPYRAGGEWIVLILFTIWLCDTAAYFVGSRFGRHKLAPQTSPNKTVEGAVGGIVGGILTAWICQALFARSLAAVDALVIGAIVGILGQASDLVESRFKRDAGVKDTSSILPGHGGILDRFDSQLMSVPVIYFYLYWFL